jgi:hypothetical protein
MVHQCSTAYLFTCRGLKIWRKPVRCIACYGSSKNSLWSVCWYRVTSKCKQASTCFGLNVHFEFLCKRTLCVMMNCHKILEYHDTVQCCSCYLGPWAVVAGGVEGRDVIHLVTPQLLLLLWGWAFRPFHHLSTWHQWAVLALSRLPGQGPFIQGWR